MATGLAWVRGSEFQGDWLGLSGVPGRWVSRGPTLGFPLEIQVFYPFSRFVGVGAYAFYDLNAPQPFSGATVTIVMGKLR
ncbi:MAG: hypothetical protein QHJ34_08950 [bacterium]|jgi:hypothetical protein|nr:hypothetical protein [candidate division KSB1 bacterium]MDH7560342.1 hypothetical protein [bacterium]